MNCAAITFFIIIRRNCKYTNEYNKSQHKQMAESAQYLPVKFTSLTCPSDIKSGKVKDFFAAVPNGDESILCMSDSRDDADILLHFADAELHKYITIHYDGASRDGFFSNPYGDTNNMSTSAASNADTRDTSAASPISNHSLQLRQYLYLHTPIPLNHIRIAADREHINEILEMKFYYTSAQNKFTVYENIENGTSAIVRIADRKIMFDRTADSSDDHFTLDEKSTRVPAARSAVDTNLERALAEMGVDPALFKYPTDIDCLEAHLSYVYAIANACIKIVPALQEFVSAIAPSRCGYEFEQMSAYRMIHYAIVRHNDVEMIRSAYNIKPYHTCACANCACAISACANCNTDGHEIEAFAHTLFEDELRLAEEASRDEKIN
jgi:hypothetical protein